MTCITGIRAVRKKTRDFQFDQALDLVDRLGMSFYKLLLSMLLVFYDGSCFIYKE